MHTSATKVREVQPFSQKSRTATVPKVFQIGFCGVLEADLEFFWNSWSVEFLGERLYHRKSVLYSMNYASLEVEARKWRVIQWSTPSDWHFPQNPALQQSQKCSKSASAKS